MTLFNRITKENTLADLTKTKAQEIYEALKTKDVNTLFLEDNIATEYTEQVEAEMKRLESEMISKMSGSFVIEEGYPATYTEDGEIDEEAVDPIYYSVTTEIALKASMSSKLLDVDKLVADVRVWSDGNPDDLPTWTVFKATFN